MPTLNASLSACRQRIAQFRPFEQLRLIRRPVHSATPLTLDRAIQQHRSTRTITSGAVQALIVIANQQFQLDRCADNGTAPLPIQGVHVFRGLRDALVRLDAAGDHALAARSEQARTEMYMEMFLMREQAKVAVQRWEANLAHGIDTNDSALVVRAQAWLGTDAEAIAQAEKSFALLEHAESAEPAPSKRPARFNPQAMAHMKP
jgi:hypothetical protein